jgi:hypothetical protein
MYPLSPCCKQRWASSTGCQQPSAPHGDPRTRGAEGPGWLSPVTPACRLCPPHLEPAGWRVGVCKASWLLWPLCDQAWSWLPALLGCCRHATWLSHHNAPLSHEPHAPASRLPPSAWSSALTAWTPGQSSGRVLPSPGGRGGASPARPPCACQPPAGPAGSVRATGGDPPA